MNVARRNNKSRSPVSHQRRRLHYSTALTTLTTPIQYAQLLAGLCRMAVVLLCGRKRQRTGTRRLPACSGRGIKCSGGGEQGREAQEGRQAGGVNSPAGTCPQRVPPLSAPPASAPAPPPHTHAHKHTKTTARSRCVVDVAGAGAAAVVLPQLLSCTCCCRRRRRGRGRLLSPSARLRPLLPSPGPPAPGHAPHPAPPRPLPAAPAASQAWRGQQQTIITCQSVQTALPIACACMQSRSSSFSNLGGSSKQPINVNGRCKRHCPLLVFDANGTAHFSNFMQSRSNTASATANRFSSS